MCLSHLTFKIKNKKKTQKEKRNGALSKPEFSKENAGGEKDQELMESKYGMSIYNLQHVRELDRETVAGVAVRTVYSYGHLRNRCHALWDTECVCTRVWSSTVPC